MLFDACVLLNSTYRSVCKIPITLIYRLLIIPPVFAAFPYAIIVDFLRTCNSTFHFLNPIQVIDLQALFKNEGVIVNNLHLALSGIAFYLLKTIVRHCPKWQRFIICLS